VYILAYMGLVNLITLQQLFACCVVNQGKHRHCSPHNRHGSSLCHSCNHGCSLFFYLSSLYPLCRGAKMGPCSLAEFHTRLTLPLERLIPVQPFTRHARTLCVPGWAGCAGRAGLLPRDVIIAG